MAARFGPQGLQIGDTASISVVHSSMVSKLRACTSRVSKAPRLHHAVSKPRACTLRHLRLSACIVLCSVMVIGPFTTEALRGPRGFSFVKALRGFM